ncbi:cytochrome bd ubiquinol oxidase subunit II [Neoasaia chiangmaiensis NBRC 101099]|uniref:Ubiquinol oxidase subunit II n=1 Tax=Neoasaia chiangmaiensis TaxID=320497 RepID=A0A1U9KN29_9PROT|nr:cytochrome d ubiquinol oxidase subunit II [Neoasaia chiangmaiensis]AQS87196.1 ubiquinol oxidase subunit II [Neoasaia chiangmaiensis]GBR38313.1 cytochrome bd ubiquinol oxidase subunit II [Neoasaia chiangmaiensis NBRC 101099]GEN15954.1 ubiquinol oxidase subunit II, cyanide insensitive [Neoasaia chiangmaiensis]
MSNAAYWLPIVWAVLAATAIFIYVVLDGFDLGIGILFLGETDETHRNTMVNTVAPVWDGNETWMIYGGAALYGVFPVAYGTILPALYLPVLFMLLSLILRGVAFEFRSRMISKHSKFFWDWAFCLGSLVAAVSQGAILGTLIQGIKVEHNTFVGSPWDWLAPFPLFCGFAVAVGYTLLGATWLVWRTETDLQTTMRKLASVLAVAMFALIGLASLWTPYLHVTYMNHWTAWPQIVLVLPVPVAVLAIAAIFGWAIYARYRLLPFLCTLGWFFLCFTGLGINIWPYIVPPTITIWDASSPPSSQAFLLAGSVFLLPIIIAYTAYSYYVFRGTVTAEHHYH